MKNKTALITGSARRLGKEIALKISKLGYDIVLHYNNTPEADVKNTISEVQNNNVTVYPFKSDISKYEGIINLFNYIKKEAGGLDLLINNAAIFKHYDFFDIDEKVFDNFINTNLKSTFFCSQEAARLMKNNNGISRIINLASLGGILNWTGFMPYGISKAGVIKFTKLLAKKLAPNILVNAIAPGTVELGNDSNINPNELKKYPMKRFAAAEDITNIIEYLTRDNNYITGQIFVVDGGRVL
jgi:NAD(P)-dependent dehydrogenase (short-subunit alcohol dehydrogenase family)